jgi:hypothetical protein
MQNSAFKFLKVPQLVRRPLSLKKTYFYCKPTFLPLPEQTQPSSRVKYRKIGKHSGILFFSFFSLYLSLSLSTTLQGITIVLTFDQGSRIGLFHPYSPYAMVAEGLDNYCTQLKPILHTWIGDSCFTCDGS